jgi:hypothetical protein
VAVTPKPKPDKLSLSTIRSRLHMVEHCIVRDYHAAGEMLREVGRLLDGVAEHVEHLHDRLDRAGVDK